MNLPDLSRYVPLGLNANEIQIPCVKHHRVSSLIKSHQNTHNSVKYEVQAGNMKMSSNRAKYELLIKQYCVHLWTQVVYSPDKFSIFTDSYSLKNNAENQFGF